MTDEEFVRQKQSNARCTGVPVKGSHSRKIAHYEIVIGLNAHPPCIGIGKTQNDAWREAREEIEQIEKEASSE